MTGLSLQCAKDGSVAYLEIPSDMQEVSLEYLESFLRKNHVVSGVNYTTLEETVDKQHIGKKIVVASSSPMEPGIDGRLEWFIDLEKRGKPRELQNGRVDHRDLQVDSNVQIGDKIVRFIPARPGRPGKTVFGTPVLPPDINESFQDFTVINDRRQISKSSILEFEGRVWSNLLKLLLIP